ncbi:MAG: hypothetical protein WKF76_08285 [Nocardioidaceae bacterium]
MRDVDGRVDKIRVDLSADPGLHRGPGHCTAKAPAPREIEPGGRRRGPGVDRDGAVAVA